ncbi:hypothetical protein VIGAN_01430700, partial [Vigna angularis var. angularis]
SGVGVGQRALFDGGDSRVRKSYEPFYGATFYHDALYCFPTITGTNHKDVDLPHRKGKTTKKTFPTFSNFLKIHQQLI